MTPLLDTAWFITSVLALLVGAGVGYYQGFRDGQAGPSRDEKEDNNV